MRIKTSLPAFTYIKLSDKKYAFVDQDGYIKMKTEDFLMFYRSVVPYTEYVEEIEPEYYERLTSILPASKIVASRVKEVERNDILEIRQTVEEETGKTEQPSSSGDEKPERSRRKRGSN